MENWSFEPLSRSFPKGSEVGSLRWTNTVSFMFYNFLSNSAIIYVARNKENVVVAKNLNLAVTDFGVELIVQPSGHNKIKYWCLQYKIRLFHNFVDVLYSLGVLAVSVGRFLAFHLHLKYWSWGNLNDMAELDSTHCVIFSVVVVWLLSDMYLRIGLFPGGVGIVLTT